MFSDQHSLFCATAVATFQLFHLALARSSSSSNQWLLESYYGSYQPLGFPPTLAHSPNIPSLCCIIVNVSGFCNIHLFYRGGSLVQHPTPNLEDQGVTLCLISTLQPVRHSLPYKKYKTPADIDLELMVMAPFWAGPHLWSSKNLKCWRHKQKRTNQSHCLFSGPQSITFSLVTRTILFSLDHESHKWNQKLLTTPSGLIFTRS